jgi:hypothetical protein
MRFLLILTLPVLVACSSSPPKNSEGEPATLASVETPAPAATTAECPSKLTGQVLEHAKVLEKNLSALYEGHSQKNFFDFLE